MISALREWMAEMNSSVTVAVSYLGKVKTSLQMIAITILLAMPPSSESAFMFGAYALLYVAALMTLWSMSVYLQAAWPTLRQGWSRQRIDSGIGGSVWRLRPESNRRTGLCRPLHSHSATQPSRGRILTTAQYDCYRLMVISSQQ